MTSLFLRLIWFLTRLLLGVLFYATPVLGFWLASSLEAYLGGPPWMAWTAGALLFPIIPLFWELHSWAYRKPDRKAWLTPLDRISLKTFVVGLTFLIGLLYFFPTMTFVALSTRGDWMLDEIKDTRADSARRVLFATAGGLQWLYTATKSNPYKSQIDTEEVERTVQAAKQLDEESATQRKQEIAKNDEQEADEKKKKEQKEAPAAKPSSKWPWKQATLHPAVASMPASAETSINSVAQYIAKREKDPTQRIKALHDYVADRIAYDSASFYAGKYPSQSAKTVFKTRKGVCAGYANLLSALASAMGENIVVVVGDSRESAAGDKLADGGGHAWNAARINGKWYLIDATWDAGSVSREKGFTKEYKTEYLLTPPEVMIQSHFPEKETWQLLDQPLSLGEFMRQPMLSPSFLAANLTLIRPTRAVNETDSNAVVIVKNPDKQWLMVDLEQNGKRIGDGSGATREKYAKLERPLPEKGRYRLNIFLNKESEYGEYDYVGAVDFVNR